MAQAQTFQEQSDNTAEQFGGGAGQMAQQDQSDTTADVIGGAEKDGAEGVMGGQGERLKGTMKDVEGKMQEGWGKMTDNPDDEARGLGNQVAGNLDKLGGDAEEDVSKGVFNGAVQADADYMKS